MFSGEEIQYIHTTIMTFRFSALGSLRNRQKLIHLCQYNTEKKKSTSCPDYIQRIEHKQGINLTK